MYRDLCFICNQVCMTTSLEYLTIAFAAIIQPSPILTPDKMQLFAYLHIIFYGGYSLKYSVLF